ncbi:hypothetical protein V5799_000290 [Amblyomma americanum]|uniref:Peptidase M13 N-terminal domain-containing protein n=1 Tax=Amblyomma americanum TaxID=6943 RepID=A0AAQ4D3G8_AMBAM
MKIAMLPLVFILTACCCIEKGAGKALEISERGESSRAGTADCLSTRNFRIPVGSYLDLVKPCIRQYCNATGTHYLRIMGSPDKQVPAKSHRTSGTASPTSKKKTVVSGSHKESGHQPATPGVVPGSSQPHLNATSAVGLGAKAPGVPSPSSSSAVSPTLSGQKAPGTPSPSSSSVVSPTLSGQNAPGTPSPSSSSAVSPTLRGQKAPGTPSPSSSSAVSPTLSGQKAPGVPSPSSSSAVSPTLSGQKATRTPSPSSSSAVSPTLRGQKAPGTPSPSSSSAVSPTLSGQGSPSSATRTCGREESTPSMASPPGEDSDATLPKGINLDQAHPVQPPEPKPPSSTTAQRPPPVQEPNSSDDGAASKESVLRPLSKMLSHHITKDKTPMKTNQAPQKTSSRTAPTTVGTNYYTTLKDLATSIHTDSLTPRAGSSNRTPGWQWRHALILAAVGVVTFALLYSRFWQRRETLTVADCNTEACQRHVNYFTDSLNYSADPCVDFGSFVCSKWKPSTEFITRFSLEMIRTHIHRMTRHLRRNRLAFNASVMSAAFLRECLELNESDASLASLEQFATDQGIPWPYKYSQNSGRIHSGRHPLHVVFELSLKWGIHSWFEAVVREIEANDKATHGLFVYTSETPSAWLNYVRTLKRLNAREKYYQGFCKLFGVPLPSRAELQERFEIEDSVLSTIDKVLLRGRQMIMEERPRTLVGLTRNVSLTEWLELAKLAARASTDLSEVPFYFTDRAIIEAIDEIFYRHKHEDLLDHLAWWFVQQHIVLASPTGHILFAGDERRAHRLMDAYCYEIISEKMGLLLAAESAIGLFSEDERNHAWRLIHLLVTAAGKFLRLLPWSELGDQNIASAIAEMELMSWPGDVERMNKGLSFMYKRFLEVVNNSKSFFSNWIHASNILQSLTNENYYRLHLSWRWQLRRLFEYDYWSNQLQVSHAALAAPLYYGSGEGVLRAATFGGFGSRFLAAVYNVINLSAFFLDKQNISQLSPKGIILFTEPSCGSRYEELLKRILGVATAWHLFKHAGSPVEDHDTSLITVDDRVLTADEIFFITYCRSLCEVNKRNRCSDVLRQVTAFADTFKCKEGTPMRSLDRCGVVKDFEAKLRTMTVDTVF